MSASIRKRSIGQVRTNSRAGRGLANLGLIVSGLVLWLAGVSGVYGWGAAAHRMANGSAIQCLPAEVRGFFEANRQYLVDHANDPEGWTKKDRYERMRHYIYLDKYGVFPYINLPHSYKAAIQRYGKGRIGRDGSVPWQIGEYSLKLTNDMK